MLTFVNHDFSSALTETKSCPVFTVSIVFLVLTRLQRFFLLLYCRKEPNFKLYNQRRKNREDFFEVNWLIPELLLPLCQNESSCENMCSYMFICLHFPMELLKLDWRKSDERHFVKYQLEVRKGKTIVQKNSKTQRFEKSSVL